MSAIHLITMPQWGLEMTEGSVSAWHIAVGDRIAKGRELVEVETSKIMNTMEAMADMPGVVRRLVAQVGDTIPVGGLLGVTADEEVSEEEIDRFLAGQGTATQAPPTAPRPDEPKPSPSPAVAPVPALAPAPETAPVGSDFAAAQAAAAAVITVAASPARVPAASARPSPEELARIAASNAGIVASPVARRAADRVGVDLSTIDGTGRHGRISLDDVLLAEPSAKREMATLPAPSAAQVAQFNARADASPIARRMADRLAVDLRLLAGTGRNGRISVADVEALQGRATSLAIATAPPTSTPLTSAPATAASADVRAGPAARKVAADLGVDLTLLKGTGPRNLVLKADVHGAHQATQQALTTAGATAVSEDHTLIELTPMRKAIAASLTRSKQTIPHFYLTVDLPLDGLIALRQAINSQAQGRRKLSLNDFLLRATALALAEVPAANVHFTDGGIKQFTGVHLCVAVAIEGGLLTPVIRDAQTKSVFAIAAEAGELAQRSRSRTLTQAQMGGGTFTVSNLGMFGIRQFDAVINPPQGGILAVGAVRREACEAEGGGVRFRSMMSVTLSCDHRAIDGAVGAEFLAALRKWVERPYALLG